MQLLVYAGYLIQSVFVLLKDFYAYVQPDFYIFLEGISWYF